MTPPTKLTSWNFEHIAERTFSDLMRVDLRERKVTVARGMTRRFRLVSGNSRMVGATIWFDRRKSSQLPIISEQIWLLQKLRADQLFVVLAPRRDWAEQYMKDLRPVVPPVRVFFLDETGQHELT